MVLVTVMNGTVRGILQNETGMALLIDHILHLLHLRRIEGHRKLETSNHLFALEWMLQGLDNNPNNLVREGRKSLKLQGDIAV
jgi:hypothetical protein